MHRSNAESGSSAANVVALIPSATVPNDGISVLLYFMEKSYYSAVAK